MTLAQAVNALLFLVWPLMIGMACLLFYYRIIRMSYHQRLALEQFARMAVEKTEMQSEEVSGHAKKALATNEVSRLFDAYRLPKPSAIAIDIAIESAVYRIRFLRKIETMLHYHGD